MRLSDRIKGGKLDGITLFVPLLNNEGECLWPGKFDTKQKIEELHRSVASELAWQQEYLLNPLADETRIIPTDWLKYYDELPTISHGDEPVIYTGIDLAMSQEKRADYTAMVSAQVIGRGKNIKIYILPNPVNEKLLTPMILSRAQKLHLAHGNSQYNRIFVENVQGQDYMVQDLKNQMLPVTGIRPQGDKRERLSFASKFVFNGTVFFPRRGAEELIRQLVGFGLERHDDLADAFSMLILETIKHRPAKVDSTHVEEMVKSAFSTKHWEKISGAKLGTDWMNMRF